MEAIKKEIRILGIDDGPFDKFKNKTTLIVGVIMRGGTSVDAILSTKVKVDGNNATSKLILMIKKCKYYPQLRCIMLNGIAVGEFNVIDIEELWKKTEIPVIVVIRHMPDQELITATLRKLNMDHKLGLIKKAGEINKVDHIYIQYKGLTLKKAMTLLQIACTQSYLPEPVRLAHIIATGIVKGESKGRA